MKHDEFAFLNHQLAGMLKSGIPIEGALRQLCREMQRGKLRTELERLEADLAAGLPLKKALIGRQLPEFYMKMLHVGVESNDLPAVLTMLADYYERLSSITIRLKTLMIYPAIVLVMALALSGVLVFLYIPLMENISRYFLPHPGSVPISVTLGLWLPPIFLGSFSLVLLGALSFSGRRRFLRWRLPAFREANLSQLAAAMSLLLKSGCPLADAIALMKHLEGGAPLSADLDLWQERLDQGYSKFTELALPGKVIPPLFIWLVANAQDDLVSGFERAAKIYHGRFLHKTEMLLANAFPVVLIFLGFLVLSETFPILRMLIMIITTLGQDCS